MLAHIRHGQRHPGVSAGPDCLYAHDLGDGLAAAGRTIRREHRFSRPERASDGETHGRDDWAALRALADSIEESLKSGGFPLVLGGDHSIAFSSIEAVLRAEPDARILYIDAHADINTPMTSPSGNIHGMPVAAHLGLFGGRDIAELDFIGTRLTGDRIAYIGLRDVDEGEEEFLDRFGITRFTAAETRRLGMAQTVSRALAAIDPDGIHPVYVSFDIDVSDPVLAPATGVPVADGFDGDELILIARALQACGRVIGMDVVEINPDLAPDADAMTRTLDLAARFITGSLRAQDAARIVA